MRVLSFIPAFLLAAASFVAAAPTSATPSNSCMSSYTGGTGSDASLQPVISIITEATTTISPLNDKLTALKGDSSSCTPDALSGIVVEIDAAVKTCVSKLQATASVSLDGVYLVNLCTAIYGLLAILLGVVGNLIACILIIGESALATIQGAVCGLLNDVLTLVGCLKVYIVADITAVLTPILGLVIGAVDVCLAFFLKVSV